MRRSGLRVAGLVVVMMVSSPWWVGAGETASTLPGAVEYDWRWVHGAVFVPTNAVNEAQQWDQYDPAVNERELHYASVYGINCVRVFLHYLVYVKKKAALLNDIEDFLTRAQKYHIKTEFVFFDSCWNEPSLDILKPDYVYSAPVWGAHNSRWLKSPGIDALQHHYNHQAEQLKEYVQDIVNAHRDDPRIAFWETNNEPDNSKETARLMADALQWIHETGTKIPVTATAGSFAGKPYSDFVSWHEYGGFPLGGDPIHSLCTECMNRREQSVPGIVSHWKGKVGFIVWEFGIGRDNCRFSWGQTAQTPAKEEPAKPFHGLVFPDGHPWSVDDIKAWLGDEAFAQAPLFKVDYYRDADFHELAKESVTPMIDFDLNDEKGTNVPDSTIPFPDRDWSVRWAGTIVAPQGGNYTFDADGDNAVKIIVNGKTIVNKPASERASGVAALEADRRVPVQIDYVHAGGRSSLHVRWAGPGLELQPLTPTILPTRLP
jgi:hypothetical protein